MFNVDLENMSSDDALPDESVDGCIEFMQDQCSLRLGINLDKSMIISNFAHMCPHTLEPSASASKLALLGLHMNDIAGHHGSARIRSLLIRDWLKLPGSPPELETSDLLQEPVDL